MFHEFIYEFGCTKVPDVPGSDTWRGAGRERSRGRRDHAAQRGEEGREAGGGMKRKRRKGTKCRDGGMEDGWHGGGRRLTGSSLARHARPTGPGDRDGPSASRRSDPTTSTISRPWITEIIMSPPISCQGSMAPGVCICGGPGRIRCNLCRFSCC